MAETSKVKKTYKNGKRKRLPVFSILLVICYLIVAGIFIFYGFGDGRSANEQPDSVAVATPLPLILPDITPDPAIREPVPLPPPVQVKGIWLGAWWIAEDEGLLDRYIELCETTELNTLVIDIKEEYGYVTMPVSSDKFPINENILINDMGELIEELNDKGIYTIARVVCFKDPRWGAKNPHLALRDKQGNRWKDRSDVGWLNPYERDNWEYIAELCLEAANLGFKEIQLDYVRFPADGRLSEIDFGPAGELQTKAEVIAEFMTFIRDTMLEVGVRTSADVFGIIALSDNDAQIIGQDPNLLFNSLHYISPMIYPSHFSNINQNGVGQYINGVLFETPDKEPHDVVYHTLQHFIRKRDPDRPEKAIIRPYLQSFTAGYLGEGMFINYGPEEIRAQIEAVYASGLDEWILWSNHSRYNPESFLDD